MYFKTSDYPVFKGVDKTERNKIVSDAIRAHNKWINIRFILVAAGLFIFLFSFSSLRSILALPEWMSLLAFPVSGVLFYAYLLWEINVAVFEAVSLHTSVADDQVPPTPASGLID